MLLSMAAYAVWFTITNKKSLAREDERMKAVRAQLGVPIDEKKG
jgi:hypothetical protein